VRLIESDKSVVKIYAEHLPLSIYRLERVIMPCDKVGAILSSREERVVSVSNGKMWFLCWWQKWNAGTAFRCHWCSTRSTVSFNWLWRKPRGLST